MKYATLETVFQALNDAGSFYLVAGGVAVNIHGYQRMTADLDLAIKLDSDNIRNTLIALEKLGFIPIIPVTMDDFANPETRNEWIHTKNMQVLSLQSNQYSDTTIDIFVTEPFDFKLEYESALVAEVAKDMSIRVVSLQTLIDMKSLAARPRDLDDIQHLTVISNEKGK